MSNMIPKSLHTVRVLVVMAQLIRHNDLRRSKDTVVNMAAAELGYSPLNDDYGLCAKAVAQLEAGQ